MVASKEVRAQVEEVVGGLDALDKLWYEEFLGWLARHDPGARRKKV